MSRIAIGAALENLIRKARSHGWGVELELLSILPWPRSG